MIAVSRNRGDKLSWLRMAPNMPFHPLAKFGLCRSMRSRFSSLPPVLRERIAATSSGGPAWSLSGRYGMPDFEIDFGCGLTASSACAEAAATVVPHRTAAAAAAFTARRILKVCMACSCKSGLKGLAAATSTGRAWSIRGPTRAQTGSARGCTMVAGVQRSMAKQTPARETRKMELEELLLRHGSIDEQQLNRARAEQSTLGGDLGRILVDLGFVSEELLVRALAHQLGIKMTSPDRRGAPPDLRQ